MTRSIFSTRARSHFVGKFGSAEYHSNLIRTFDLADFVTVYYTILHILILPLLLHYYTTTFIYYIIYVLNYFSVNGSVEITRRMMELLEVCAHPTQNKDKRITPVYENSTRDHTTHFAHQSLFVGAQRAVPHGQFQIMLRYFIFRVVSEQELLIPSRMIGAGNQFGVF